MELRWLVKQWKDYSHNDGRSVKTHTEEPVLQYRLLITQSVSDGGMIQQWDEWQDVPTVTEET